MDLRHSLIPDDLIEDLLHSMPKHTGPDLEVDRHLPKYDYIGFMERMAGEDASHDNGVRGGGRGGRERGRGRENGVVNGGVPMGQSLSSSPRKENARPVNGVEAK